MESDVNRRDNVWAYRRNIFAVEARSTAVAVLQIDAILALAPLFIPMFFELASAREIMDSLRVCEKRFELSTRSVVSLFTLS